MNESEVLSTLTRIMRDLLGNESIQLDMRTTRADLPELDSFSYVNFIAATEAEFGIRFRVSMVEGFGTIGDIVGEILKMKR